MRYILLLLLLILSNSNLLFAQYDYPITIGVLPLDNQNVSQNNASKVHNIILVLLDQDSRFQLVDISARDKVNQEKEKQKDIGFIDGKMVEQNRNQGAEFILSGTINSLGTTYDREQKRYFSYCNITLNIYDVVTNTLLASKIVTEKAKSKSNGKVTLLPGMSIPTDNGIVKTEKIAMKRKAKVSAEQAIDEMLATQLPTYIRKLIDKAFPSELEIFKIVEVKNQANPIVFRDKIILGGGKKKYDALIIGGEELGINRNITVKIISKRPVQTKEKIVYYEEVIGTMKMTKLHGEFTRFRITRGNVEVMKEIMEDESKMLIVRY